MSLLSNQLNIGNLFGIIIDFEVVGDVLTRHTHGENDAHITIVARGKVRMDVGTCPEGKFIIDETHELNAGACIDTPPGLWHEITSLVDNSRIYNIVKYPNGTNTTR